MIAPGRRCPAVRLGFTVLLTQMEPVPQALKRMFSVFGMGSLGEGVCTVVLTVLATDCVRF